MFRSLIFISCLVTVLAALKNNDNFNDTQISKLTGQSSGISHSTKELLTKFHGIAFLFAWFFCVSIAFFCARYLRDLAPDVQPFGIRIWYHVHRTLNIIAVVLMVVGLTTILIAHQWRWLGPKVNGGAHNTSATAYHSICGLLSVIIAWLQPLNALLRCDPNNSRRVYFNWFHRIFGVIGWVLAAITIVLACNNFGTHFTDSKAALSLCSAFLGFCGASFIVAEIFKIINSQKSEVNNNGFNNYKQRTLISRVHSYIIIIFAVIAFAACVTISALIANKN